MSFLKVESTMFRETFKDSLFIQNRNSLKLLQAKLFESADNITLTLLSRQTEKELTMMK